jgi:hypothetical protein
MQYQQRFLPDVSSLKKTVNPDPGFLLYKKKAPQKGRCIKGDIGIEL